MEVGGIQHVITHVPHKEPAAEVTVEGLRHELVASYLIHAVSPFPPRTH